jgi:thiamine-phosphate pyrophosphorylase
MNLPRLLVLTDRRQLPQGRDLPRTVARCAEAGLTTVLLRELDLPQSARADLADRLAADVQVISAHGWLPAAAAAHLSADQPVASHLPLASRPPAAPDLTVAGPTDRLHGRSCHTVAEVIRAVADGAAYLTVSPVLTSRSKPGYGPALGKAGLRRLAAAAEVPVFALGGVTPGDVAGLRAAGAHGVAVMGAVMRASDPAAVVAQILTEAG